MNLVRFQKPAYNYNINRMLNDMLNDSYKTRNAKYCTPSVNIKENETDFKLYFSVPGYKKEDISIKNKEGLLTIKSEVKNKQEEDGYRRFEFSVNSFERSFDLPENVDSDSISASYVDGILTVTIPKKEKADESNEMEISIQ